MKNVRRIQLAFLVLALTCSVSAHASLSPPGFDFLFEKNSVHNDSQLFMHLTVGNLGFPRPVVEPILPRMRDVETDLPVVLFLARESGRTPESIVDMRVRGLSWSVVFSRCQVPHDVLFTGIDRDPGPPYGRAWGYWKKHPRRMEFSDRDIVGLVQVQVGHRIVGVTPFELARARGEGRSVYVVVADKKGRPYREGNAGRSKRGGHGNAGGQGKRGGHGKGH